METNPPADDSAAENPSEPTTQSGAKYLSEIENGSGTPEARADENGEANSENQLVRADDDLPAEEAQSHAASAGDGVADAEIGDGREGAGAGESAPADELSELTAASQKARLAPEAEERMTSLLRKALTGGRAGVARAIEALPQVPWIVGVRAVEAEWAELTTGFRTQLLAGLAKDESDPAKRLRLSLARALFKLDVPVALKMAVGVVKELRDKETGELAPRQAQIFANVFIGRARPWLAQLPLAELKPAEADMIAQCALLAVFTIPHPPLTQLGVLKWAQENERLAKLSGAPLEAVKRGVSRWSGRWQSALRKEVPELPEEIASVLREESRKAEDGRRKSSETRSESETGGGDMGEHERHVDEDTEHESVEDAERTDQDSQSSSDFPLPPSDLPPRPVYEPRPQSAEISDEPRERGRSRERPVYTPRNAPANGPAIGAQTPSRFHLGDALRQIEAHVQSLRNELAAAQSKSREREDRRRGPERERIGPIVEGAPTPEELARLNQQLEARNGELQARIDDMAQHSEDVATSTGAMSSEPVNDTGAQLRTLLGLKLQEDFADFLALEKESNDLVVQQHYKGLLRHVFEVLQQLEVPLKAAE